MSVDLRQTFAGRCLLSMLIVFGAVVFMWVVFWLPLPSGAEWIVMFCVLVTGYLTIVLWVNNPHARAKSDQEET